MLMLCRDAGRWGGEAIAPAALVTDSPEIVHKVERSNSKNDQFKEEVSSSAKVITITYSYIQ